MPARPLPASLVSRLARFSEGRFPVASMLRPATWAMLALVLVFPLVMSVSTTQLPGKLPSGIQVGDVVVGGMTLASAHEVLDERIADLQNQPASVAIEDRVWMPRPADLGITYDARASRAALTPSGDAWELATGTVTPIVINFDPERFHAFIDDLEQELGGGAVDAGVTIEGREVIVTPSRPGLMIDRLTLESTLRHQLTSLAPISLTAEASQVDASITTAEAEEIRVQADQVLSEPYILTLADASWALAPEFVAPALRVVPVSGDTLQLSWDATALDPVISEIAGEIETEAEDAWVQDLGTKSWLVPATDGRSLDREHLLVALEKTLTTGDHEIALNVSLNAVPKVTTEEQMAKLGITDVIAVGNSVYAGSGPGRTNNVEVAAYMIDGTLVAPGDIFSFNAAVGSLFSGQYMDAGSYLDGPDGQSLAGGVCQVSTTVFRAALDAGFPIVEWWPHSYRSSFYERGGWSPGFDAAIVQDGENPAASTDFRFQNTTDSWLMISAQVSADGELTVEILGADPGYEVTFNEPVVEVLEVATDEVTVVEDAQLPSGTVDEQPAMDGLRVTVVRHVRDADGNVVSEDTFVSSYGAYGAIRRVSPDMSLSASGD